MADDTIYNYVQNFIDGKNIKGCILGVGKIQSSDASDCFHTISALDTLKFVGCEVVIWEQKITINYFLHVV